MKKYFSLMLAVLGLAACQPEQEIKVWPELAMSFEQTSYSQTLGEMEPVEFTVTGIDGAEVKASVEFQDDSWSAEINLNPETGAGVLYVTAPEAISSTTATVTVVDEANERTVSEELSFSSTASGLDPISVAFAQEAYSVNAEDGRLELVFSVSGLGSATLDLPTAADVTTTLTVSDVTYNAGTAAGTIVITVAEDAPDAEVSLQLTVNDSYNRTATANVKVTVVAKEVVVPSPGPAGAVSNCYIVKPGESVTFARKYEGITEMSLAWQDAQNLISSMTVSTQTGEITVATGNVAGNALVLGKNAEGVTLWSWHIWVTDFDPVATAVTVDGVTFMDRNLGAVNATPGDVGAIGQAYQWGRKDPMPRALSYVSAYSECKIYDMDGAEITPYIEKNASGGTYYKFMPSAAADAVVNVDNITANPEYFYNRNEYNVAWWFNVSPDYAKDFWGGVSGKKGVYDPCPQGWKVPVVTDGKHPYEFVTTEAAVVDKDRNGMKYTSGNDELWFPCTGERTRSEGLIARTSRGGNYWTGTFDSLFAKDATSGHQEHELYKYMQFKADGKKYITGWKRQEYVATGLAVRCVKE